MQTNAKQLIRSMVIQIINKYLPKFQAISKSTKNV